VVHRAIGVDNEHHCGRIFAEAGTSEIEREAFPPTIRIEAFHHLNSHVARDRGGRIRAIVGDEKDSGAAICRLLQFSKSRVEDVRFVVRGNDDDGRNGSSAHRRVGQRAQSDEDLDGKTKGQQEEWRQNQRDNDGHKSRLANIDALRDWATPLMIRPKGGPGNLRQFNRRLSS
jgi:hypothetical protein